MSAEAVGVDPRQEPSLLRWRIAVLEPKVKRSQAIFRPTHFHRDGYELRTRTREQC
jgi:hypothetical protein